MDAQAASGIRSPHIQGTKETDQALLAHCNNIAGNIPCREETEESESLIPAFCGRLYKDGLRRLFLLKRVKNEALLEKNIKSKNKMRLPGVYVIC